MILGPSLTLLLLGAAAPADGADGSGSHWAWSRPTRPALPTGSAPHPVDRFIDRRLQVAGLAPSPPADPAILLRRLTLDLTGLPPRLEDVLAFQAQPDDASYLAAVDRLLEDPGFGEQWARWWLDLARYADTQGYEKDSARNIWRWRDWVIDALQDDMPLDRFTIEQLAGDLLPDATPDQVLATAFHRNTMTNDEGGTDDEEFRVAAVVDRVNTTMEVWMGLTMACAQCHEHKVDPFTQEEYYGLFAIFNQTADMDRRDDLPTLFETTKREDARLEASRAAMRALEAEFAAEDPELARLQAEWEAGVLERLDAFDALELQWSPWITVPASIDLPPGEGDVLGEPEAGRGGSITVETDQDSSVRVVREVRARSKGRVVLAIQTSNPFRLDVQSPSGTTSLEGPGSSEPQRVTVEVDLGPEPSWIDVRLDPVEGKATFTLDALSEDLPRGLFGLLRTPPGSRQTPQANHLKRYFRGNHLPRFRDHGERMESLRSTAPRHYPATPVMREVAPERRRTTHLLHRGYFLDPGEQIQPHVPALFPQLEPGQEDRLGLARWIVSEENPLTSRVLVNRIWEQVFGLGLVETTEDFGLRGATPTHPELLDWLAIQLQEDGWSLKELLRTIVTSEAYRRSSSASDQQLREDPRNLLLARGPRVRLAAEELRDQALATGGLLSSKRWGPPVYPPQPDGLWRVVYSAASWNEATGPDRWRRGIYTFWRRTMPYPSALLFDAPAREVCVSRRHRTNTPLQALVMMNDPVFVEAAQALGRRALEEHRGDDPSRAAWLFRTALAREPRPVELNRLVSFVEEEREARSQDPRRARTWATDPLGPLPSGLDPVEAAVWTSAAQLMLNLDEFLEPR